MFILVSLLLLMLHVLMGLLKTGYKDEEGAENAPDVLLLLSDRPTGACIKKCDAGSCQNK